MRTADNVLAKAMAAVEQIELSRSKDEDVLQMLCSLIQELAANVSAQQREIDELKRSLRH